MRNYPLRIALVYFVMASLWIFLSDKVAERLFSKENLTVVQSIKGFGFVVLSALVLYFLSRRYYALIRKNETEYRRLFKDNPNPMYVFDTETLRFLTVNDAAIGKYKYTSDEFKEMTIMDIRPPAERDSIIMFLKRIEGKPYHESGIWKHLDKNGSLFYVRIFSHATMFDNHKARVVLAIDIDEQIQAEKRMQISESKVHGLINNTDDLIWMIDNKGLVVAANETFQSKFRDATGTDLTLSQKMDVEKLPAGWFIQNWRFYITKAFSGQKLRIEQEIWTNDKREYFEIILNPIYNNAGEVFNVGCFARDITQRKEIENRIKEQVDKLREVAWIQSHEVRKPLANILGLISLVKSDSSNKAELDELVEHMETSCNELDLIIKKIVETTSIEDPTTKKTQA